jgi:hypothetical protein
MTREKRPRVKLETMPATRVEPELRDRYLRAFHLRRRLDPSLTLAAWQREAFEAQAFRDLQS